jgi:hypothetical protein
MNRMLLTTVLVGTLAGCASNRSSDEPGTRVRDTTLTPRDTTNPDDTLPHIRDTVPGRTSR